MPHSEALINLYSRITVCNRRCAGVENEPATGKMGRSFYCPGKTSDVDILLVSKNPGISDPRENGLYAPLDERSRVFEHEDFVRKRFLGTNTIITSQYHANIIAWVSVILGVPTNHASVFSRVAMTALVKCHSAGQKTAALSKETKNICAGAYLYAEIDLIKPKFLLAMGTEAYNYLTIPAVRSKHLLPVGKLYHPSWSNMRGGVTRYVAEVLPKIREQYLCAKAT